MKVIHPSEQMARDHYDDLNKKPFFPKLTKYFASGPVVAMVWQGKDAIKQGRVLLGTTNPRVSSPGTIRGDYCIDMGRNVIHGSDAPDSAAHEITMWFKDEEVFDWQSCAHAWVYE